MCTYSATLAKIAQAVENGTFKAVDSMGLYLDCYAEETVIPVTIEIGGDGVTTYVRFIGQWTNPFGYVVECTKILLGYKLATADRQVYWCWGACGQLPPIPVALILPFYDFKIHWQIEINLLPGETEMMVYYRYALAQMLASGTIATPDRMGFYACNAKTLKDAVLVAGGDGVETYYTKKARIATPHIVPKVTLENTSEVEYHKHESNHRALKEDYNLEIETKVNHHARIPCYELP